MTPALGIDARVAATTTDGERFDLVGHDDEFTLTLSSLAALRRLPLTGGSPVARLRRLGAAAGTLHACGLRGHVDVAGRRIASLGRDVRGSWLPRALGVRGVDLRVGAWLRAALSGR